NVFPKCDDAEIPAITQFPDPFIDMGNENDQEDPSGNPEDPPSEDGDDLFIIQIPLYLKGNRVLIWTITTNLSWNSRILLHSSLHLAVIRTLPDVPEMH
ncbi:hypothetical protein H0H81_011318, partial [Sphagnurus paluster]